MRDWLKETPLSEVSPDKVYFIATCPHPDNPQNTSTDFWCQYLNGKEQWAGKPGIAIRFVGDAAFVKKVSEHPTLMAVEVPHDADKRWRARKPVPSWKKSKSKS